MRAEQVEAFKAEQRAAVHATIVAQREAKARRDADERADRFREGTFGRIFRGIRHIREVSATRRIGINSWVRARESPDSAT